MDRAKYISFKIGYLVLIFAAICGSVIARTWTSVSGATIDAEFVEEDRGSVILQRPDGGRLRITASLLSPEDREYVRQQSSADEEGQLSSDAITEKSVKHVLDSGVFEKPEPLNLENFPDLKFEHPQNVLFIGLQYGPSKKDVLYMAFDRESIDKLPETAFVYRLGAEGTGVRSMLRNTRTEMLKGKERTERGYSVMKFDDIEVQSDFGDLKLNAELEFVFGLGRPDILYILADIDFIQGYKKSDCVIVRGNMVKEVTQSAGEIKCVRLLAPPRYGSTG